METGWFCEFRIPRKTGECLYYETADSIYPVFILEKNGFSFIQFQRLEKKCGCCTRAARKTRIVTKNEIGHHTSRNTRLLSERKGLSSIQMRDGINLIYLYVHLYYL